MIFQTATAIPVILLRNIPTKSVASVIETIDNNLKYVLNSEIVIKKISRTFTLVQSVKRLDVLDVHGTPYWNLNREGKGLTRGIREKRKRIERGFRGRAGSSNEG